MKKLLLPALLTAAAAPAAAASVMQRLEAAVFSFLDNFSETSVVGLLIFCCTVFWLVFCGNMILDPKNFMRSALDYYHKRIGEQDPGWWMARSNFIELCITIFGAIVGVAGLFLFLLGFFI